MANDINVTISEEESINITLDGTAGGDMFRSVYDINGNNIVDKAESVDDGLGNTKTALEIYTHLNNTEKHRKMNFVLEYKSWIIEE